LIAGFIGAVVGVGIEYHELQPPKVLVLDPDVPPGVTFGTPPQYGRTTAPTEMEIVEGYLLTSGLDSGFGALVGIGMWLLYRLMRFAVKG